MASPPQWGQGTGGDGEEREGSGEQQLSQREACRVRVAVRVERSRRMVVEGGRGQVAKRPSWRDVGAAVEVVVLGAAGLVSWSYGDIFGWWRTGRFVERTSRLGATALRRLFSSCRAPGEERSGSCSFQG